jgi:hypothetical protein
MGAKARCAGATRTRDVIDAAGHVDSKTNQSVVGER